MTTTNRPRKDQNEILNNDIYRVVDGEQKGKVRDIVNKTIESAYQYGLQQGKKEGMEETQKVVLDLIGKIPVLLPSDTPKQDDKQ